MDRKEYQRQYRLAHREKAREYMRNYNLENRDKLWAKVKERRLINPEATKKKDREYQSRYKIKNPERFKEVTRAAVRRYRVKHPEKVKAASKKSNRRRYLKDPKENNAMSRRYRLANSEKLRLYAFEKYKSNLVYRISLQTRSRIRAVLKGTSKSARTLELLGCSFEELIKHLESKFVSGMSLENHGLVWHIDHIRPCASFDLTDSEQQRQCFHFSNLQPLFVFDNLSKGSKYVSE